MSRRCTPHIRSRSSAASGSSSSRLRHVSAGTNASRGEFFGGRRSIRSPYPRSKAEGVRAVQPTMLGSAPKRTAATLSTRDARGRVDYDPAIPRYIRVLQCSADDSWGAVGMVKGFPIRLQLDMSYEGRRSVSRHVAVTTHFASQRDRARPPPFGPRFCFSIHPSICAGAEGITPRIRIRGVALRPPRCGEGPVVHVDLIARVWGMLCDWL
ncbi:hypothetical protein C8R45DRAFT_401239 [Mycena sanguinolenta]|nr:hypothetical protein C8R45DRAFT_401239 [Mycena sanguinolenta]